MKQVIATAMPPKNANCNLDIQDVLSIQLRNAGTSTVQLWNGLYTLDPKETISFNVTEENALLSLKDVSIVFDVSTGPLNNLQIVVLKYGSC